MGSLLTPWTLPLPMDSCRQILLTYGEAAWLSDSRCRYTEWCYALSSIPSRSRAVAVDVGYHHNLLCVMVCTCILLMLWNLCVADTHGTKQSTLIKRGVLVAKVVLYTSLSSWDAGWSPDWKGVLIQWFLQERGCTNNITISSLQGGFVVMGSQEMIVIMKCHCRVFESMMKFCSHINPVSVQQAWDSPFISHPYLSSSSCDTVYVDQVYLRWWFYLCESMSVLCACKTLIEVHEIHTPIDVLRWPTTPFHLQSTYPMINPEIFIWKL